jgi:hypothetical protein
MTFLNKSYALESLRPGAEWVVRGDIIEWLDESQTCPTEEEIAAEIEVLEAAYPMKELRRNRDRLIAETDWWASADRTMTAEQLAYRQALRDLPANTTDPANPVWPTKP